MEARRIVLEKALTINKIILHAFQESLDIKGAAEIEKQIIETKKKLTTKEEVTTNV
jgi:hypothetical protein